MSVSDHYDSVAADYFRQYQRDQLMEGDYPANYFRLQIILRRLMDAGVSSVFEVGVGEGTPLASMAAMGFDVAGCDVSPAMVEAAKATFASRGLSADAISWGDVSDAVTLAPVVRDGAYDAAVALGVLPHVASDKVFLENMGMLVRPGGRVFIEFRNKLFSLFTFNRLTRDFIMDDLLEGVDPAVKAAVEAEISPRLAMDLPPQRGGIDGAPGYDEILARYHNPFELLETFEMNGFSDARVHWYHYHPALPKQEKPLGDAFRKAGFALEHEGSWRGMFLCSAGVIEAVRD
jgi:2-polyprenyl-3-methyl-5-hydroxy-6-metoxy-1,4-benzoquinol methylase